MPAPEERIERAILLSRGEKVMLDADLAALYGVATRSWSRPLSAMLSGSPRTLCFNSPKMKLTF